MPLFERGPQGPAGPPGRKGLSLFLGHGAPSLSLGNPGDSYIDKDVPALYGPKVGTVADGDADWGSPIALGSVASNTAAGGSDKQFQVNNSGVLAGTAKVVLDAGGSGEVHHLGKPVHEEDNADFDPSGASGDGILRAQWNKVKTSNATPTVVNSISVPAATYGDCVITVIAELTVSTVSSGTKGGNKTGKAVFQRTSGTLTLVKFKDLTDADFYTGPAVGGFAIDKNGNDTIELKGTGLVGDVTWISALHVQLAKV